MDIRDIVDEMGNNNIPVENCIPMKGRSRTPFSYLITLSRETDIKEVEGIATISNLKILWEKYTRKNNWTQCHRCQNFGHGETNCYRKPRCVKCLETHHTKDCQSVKTDTSKPQCVNCRRDHPANYNKCLALLEYLQKRDEILNANKPEIQKQQTNIPPKKTSSPTQFGQKCTAK